MGFREKKNLKNATLPETNIAPENRPLEKEIPMGNHYFQVLCLFQGGYYLLLVAPDVAKRPLTEQAGMTNRGSISSRGQEREVVIWCLPSERLCLFAEQGQVNHLWVPCGL